jgi:hypothetical protein
MMDYAERVYRDNMSVQNANIRVIPPDPRSESGPLFDGIDEYGGIDTVLKQMLNSFAKNQTPRFPIPQRLQCANVEVEKYKTCDNPGTMACSGCKLVSYCSKVPFFPFWFRLFSHRSFRNARNIIGAFTSKVCANEHFWWFTDGSMFQIVRILCYLKTGSQLGSSSIVAPHSLVRCRHPRSSFGREWMNSHPASLCTVPLLPSQPFN